MGGGLIVSPTKKAQPAVVVATEGEGGEGGGGGGGGGKVEELQRKLRKVTKEKDQLKQNNAALQKSITELQKQVSSPCMSLQLAFS